jgi:ketosteroid isomerase-like protein
MGDTLDLAREMWALYLRGDVDRLIPLLDPDVEVRPRGLPRDVYRGHDGLMQMFVEAREHGRESTVTIDQYVASGDRVAVLGRIRVRHRQFIADSSAAWLLVMRGGKLAKSVSYRSHANALRAVRGDATMRAVTA